MDRDPTEGLYKTGGGSGRDHGSDRTGIAILARLAHSLSRRKWALCAWRQMIVSAIGYGCAGVMNENR
jgi:hypothetical protein